MTQVAPAPTMRNGINVDQMYGTLDLIKQQPSLATFQFRASNRWMGGAHNRSTIQGFYAAGGEDQSRKEPFIVDAGEPAILLGDDTGPNPAEFALHALAACLTTSLVYVAAARGVRLLEVESTLEGNADVQGALGLNNEVRNGFQNIRVTFRVKADAPAEKVQELIERARSRSFVYDVMSNGVPIDVNVIAA